ncbi:zinc-dependent metalloprotease [Pseudomonas viridiflava]|uniref:matrixin family metalloprotease n=1 Tax=Pseudomonas viridiflava TaxID=33069 RepID=UPI0015E2DA54|nr:matrixin family metalloprotease [Pseudomonas viridiflava]MBA1229339.1 zinc-dependent metalloprotease [Pseudomonas viridiflava]
MSDPTPLPTLPMLCSMRDAADYQASYEAAIGENPANAAITPTYESETGYVSETGERQPRILVAFNKYWARGRTLKIAFPKNPPAPLTQPIINAARKWLPHVNLKFEFVTSGQSDIRIGLNTRLNWSEVGTDALLVPQDQSTMEFNFTEIFENDLSPKPELERIVLHEFGHALGAVHEHQHPDAKIPWNEPLLRQLLAQAGYSEELIARNFLDQYEAADFHYTAYDRDSIMHFDIPNALTLGDFEVINIGKTLSTKDIEFMKSIYPDRNNSKFEQP